MESLRNKRWLLPAFGFVAAIATNTVANAAVLPTVGALCLLPLVAIFWYIQRFSRREVGFVPGQLRHYGLGLLLPLLVLGSIALVAWLTGAVNLQSTSWSKTALEIGVTALVTFLTAAVT